MRTARPAVRICFQRVIRVMRGKSFGEPNFVKLNFGLAPNLVKLNFRDLKLGAQKRTRTSTPCGTRT